MYSIRGLVYRGNVGADAGGVASVTVLFLKLIEMMQICNTDFKLCRSKI
jgi:hypothetical protein